jgi:hypothetical protein
MKCFYLTFFLISILYGLSYNTEKKKIRSRFLTIDLKPKTGQWEGWVKFSHFAPQSGIKPKQFFQNNHFFRQIIEKDEVKRGLVPFSIIPSKFHFFMILKNEEIIFKFKSEAKTYEKLSIRDLDPKNGYKVLGEYKEGSCLELYTLVRDNQDNTKRGNKQHILNLEDFNMNDEYDTQPISNLVSENWILCFEEKNERAEFYSKLNKIVNYAKRLQIKNFINDEFKGEYLKLNSLNNSEIKNKNSNLNITIQDNSTSIEKKLLPIVDQKKFLSSMINKTEPYNEREIILKKKLENQENIIRHKKISKVKQNFLAAIQQEEKLENLYLNEIKLQNQESDKLLEEKKKKEENKAHIFFNILKEQEKEEKKIKEERKIGNELNEIKQKTKKEIEKRREQLRNKIIEIKKRAAIRRLKLENEIELIKQRLIENKLKADKSGDVKTCLKLVLSPQNLINKYCQENYSLEKVSECEDRNNFCYMCCEAEIGRNHFSKRDQCYELCDKIGKNKSIKK